MTYIVSGGALNSTPTNQLQPAIHRHNRFSFNSHFPHSFSSVNFANMRSTKKFQHLFLHIAMMQWLNEYLSNGLVEIVPSVL